MSEVKFEYKCRRCGGIDDSLCIGSKKYAFHALMDAICGTNFFPELGMKVTVIGYHQCDDGGVGVADLIGYGIEK
jgi:hypothetical protein